MDYIKDVLDVFGKYSLFIPVVVAWSFASISVVQAYFGSRLILSQLKLKSRKDNLKQNNQNPDNVVRNQSNGLEEMFK
ncbi:MAG: hypothetical protein ABIH59_03475 [archaeon]